MTTTTTTRILLALAVVLVASSTAHADDARPATLSVSERASDVFDVRWQTPIRGQQTLRASPRFPEGAEPVDGTYDKKVNGDSLVETWQVTVPGGLEGREVGVDGLQLSARSVVVQVRLASGARHKAVLSGVRSAFEVPAPVLTERARWTDGLATATRTGFTEGLHWAHVLFAVALVLAGRMRGLGFGLLAFLLADVTGRAAGVVTLPEGLAHALVALAGALAAREALLGTQRRLTLLAALAGLAHGLGTPAATVAESVGGALGLDAVHLLAGGATLALMATGPRVRVGLARAAGVVCVAVAIVQALEQPAVAAPERTAAVLPMAFVGEDAPVTTRTPSTVFGRLTALEAYLDISVFETRVEILGRLPELERWLGIEVEAGETLPVADQEALLREIEAALRTRVEVEIDGERVAFDDASLGFATQDDAGVYLRAAPEDESTSDAVVGVLLAVYTDGVPERVSARLVEVPETFGVIRARTIDPEFSRDVEIDDVDPRLDWANELQLDPMPPIETVAVREVAPVLPVVSLGLLLVGGVAVLAFRKRGWKSGAASALQVGLVLASVAAPFGVVEIPAFASTPPPTQAQAEAVTRTLLDNVYRAFNQRAEDAVYDRLEKSLVGDQLEQAYLLNRQTLEMTKVGGARAHVDVVELVSLDGLATDEIAGFAADVEWTVAGSVTHFGHRHLRQNRYAARLEVTALDGAWKIRSFDLRNTERVR